MLRVTKTSFGDHVWKVQAERGIRHGYLVKNDDHWVFCHALNEDSYTAHELRLIATLCECEDPEEGPLRDWEDKEFVDYLEQRLIPDLKESGKEATAEDFERCVSLLRSSGY
jgi:hypothetical protein